MTMKEHLDKLTQEKENGVTLTVEEADARKNELLKDAKAEVASLLFVSTMLVNALQSVRVHMDAEKATSKECIAAIEAMCNQVSKAN